MTAVERIRNVVLVGHNGSGKTSLAEVLLYRAGVIDRPGSAERGGTVMDHDREEQDRHQSLSLAVARFEWKGHTINLIDTPGHADFIGDALMGMSVADLAVFVIDGVAGVQPQDIVLWRRTSELGLPRLVFINKLDRERASFERVLADVRETFGSHADPVELPIGKESGFHGVIAVLTDEAFVYDSGSAEPAPVPDDLVAAERVEHDHLVEEVIEMDETLLEQYLEGSDPSPTQLEHLLHDAIDEAKVYPVLCGSATTPIGIDYLADFICRVGPSPADVRPPEVQAGDVTIDVRPDPEGPALAFVFKTTIDEFLGRLSMFKVLSGTIRTDDTLVNSETGAKERMHHLMSMTGRSAVAVGEVGAGEIAVVAKLSGTSTGDTLAVDGMPVVVGMPALPRPAYGIGLAAVKRSDEDRLANLLRRFVTEDPTLNIHQDAATHQTVLNGIGEAHVRIALSRLERAGVEVETEDVRVSYRETLARSVEVEGKYKKQSGGHGQFGVATVRFEPLPRGTGFEFVSEVVGGAIPKNLIPAVGAGIEEAMVRGGRFGFPLVDIRAVCTNGRFHSVDSSEFSFKMAGSLALRDAIEQVGVQVLEPISDVTVQVGASQQGDVLGDLSSLRAQVYETLTIDDLTTIKALVPTSAITRFVIDVRSLTAGAGSVEVEHHGYEVLPDNLVDRLTAVTDGS